VQTEKEVEYKNVHKARTYIHEMLTKMIFRCKIRKILGRETVWKNM